MAAAHLKTQTQTQTTSKPKRRKRRETTITTSATSDHRKLDPPTVVSPETSSWCCSATTKPLPPPPRRTTTKTTPTTTLPPPPPPPPAPANQDSDHHAAAAAAAAATLKSYLSPTASPSPLNSPSSFCKVRFSPGRVSPIMDSPSASLGITVAAAAAYACYPSSYSKFNSALNAGILNPSSPPPAVPATVTVSAGSPIDKTRSSPTLFEMMANEADCHHPRTAQILTHSGNVGHNNVNHVLVKPQVSVQDKQAILQQRVAEILGNCSPGNQFNDPGSSDLKLTLTSKDGLSVSINLHCQILVAHSRFFATKLCNKSSKQHQPLQQQRSLPQIVEISDCDDVEIYIETLRLMYCKDIRRKLMKEDVSKVLGILKVSAAIYFDAGVLSCLEYLEAVPWAEDEEEKVASLLSQLHLEGAGAGEVLKRVSVEVVAEPEERGSGSGNEEVLLKLLQVVLQGKDEKARRDMKSLVSKMLRENSSQNDLSKESLYSACNGCLQLLRHHFLRAASSDLLEVAQISRQADNLHWILDILIDRQISEDFLKTWSAQSDLSEAHSNVPPIHRYDVSRVTARLFVGIGKGQLLASKEDRCLLLQTWLEPFYDDFAWMRRASRGLDRHLIEDGLCNTILTLPLAWQQGILLAWFDRFLNSSEDCPNIQRGFQVWWRRAFWKRNGETEQAHLPRVVTAICDDS